jgi:hypothetical protein
MMFDICCGTKMKRDHVVSFITTLSPVDEYASGQGQLMETSEEALDQDVRQLLRRQFGQ